MNTSTNQFTDSYFSLKISELHNKAESLRYDHEYEAASCTFEKIAELYTQQGNIQKAQDYYAYAAIMKEHTEKWRYISSLWYKASGNISNNPVNYNDYNSLDHTYPTISFEKWDNYNEKEKVGRAYQYAAYSEDNYNGPSDSYWLYEKAVIAYKNAQNYQRMIECLISATNRYIKQYNKISDEIIKNWKDILNNKKVVSENRYIIMLAFEEIYKNMIRYDSKNAKFFYIESQKLHAIDDRKNKRYLRYLKMKIWQWFSTFNTNAYKIIIWTLLMVIVAFPYLFILSNGAASYQDALRISINNFLGIKTISSGSTCYYFVGITEVLFSYFILVIISTFLIEKVVKSLN